MAILSICHELQFHAGTYVASGKTTKTTVTECGISFLVEQIFKVLRFSLRPGGRLTKPSFLEASSYVFFMPKLSTALSRDLPINHSMEK